MKTKGKNKGDPISYSMFNKFIKDCIKTFNEHLQIKLDPKFYVPTSLRIGGTTDLTRSGYPGNIIKAKGRWKTSIWKEVYINLLWDDLSLLSGISVIDLMTQNKYPFN